jgi:hypothetical protein
VQEAHPDGGTDQTADPEGSPQPADDVGPERQLVEDEDDEQDGEGTPGEGLREHEGRSPAPADDAGEHTEPSGIRPGSGWFHAAVPVRRWQVDPGHGHQGQPEAGSRDHQRLVGREEEQGGAGQRRSDERGDALDGGRRDVGCRELARSVHEPGQDRGLEGPVRLEEPTGDDAKRQHDEH